MRLRTRSTRECARALGARGSPDVIETDGELAREELALATAEALRAGGPVGAGLSRAAASMALFHISRARVVGERHLKIWVAAPRGARAVRRHRLQLPR